jgi:hypothetical protein
LLLVAGSPAAGSARDGATHSVVATMSPAQVVSPDGKMWHAPAGVAHASGKLVATLTGDGRGFNWKITFSGVGHFSVLAADVHTGKAGRFGPVLFRLCAQCRSGQRGTTILKAGYGRELLRSAHYITVVTDKYPNGVVRGQLAAT